MSNMSNAKISPKQLALYHSPTCPFCHRVFDALHSLGFTPDLENGKAGDIALKSTRDKKNKQALVAGGGKATVPCLYIEHEEGGEWLYESLDIIAFLQNKVGAPQ